MSSLLRLQPIPHPIACKIGRLHSHPPDLLQPLPVEFTHRPGRGFLKLSDSAHTRAHHYFDYLKASTPNTIKTPRMVLVNRIEWHPAHITIKGWAMDDTGNALKSFYVTCNGQTQRVLPDSIEQFPRQDLAAYFIVMNKKFGFTLVCPLPGAGVIERGDDQGVTVDGLDDEGGVVGQYREA